MSVVVGFDLLGNLSLALQVVILFLLILGLPFVRGVNSKKNLVRHGYSTLLALILHTILILVVMVPSFITGFGNIGSLSILYSLIVWSHAILGVTAEVLGIILVAVWFLKLPSLMNCVKMKKWMLPTFIIWLISLVSGVLIHLFGMI